MITIIKPTSVAFWMKNVEDEDDYVKSEIEMPSLNSKREKEHAVSPVGSNAEMNLPSCSLACLVLRNNKKVAAVDVLFGARNTTSR